MLADPEVLPLITSTAQAFSQAVGQGIGKRPMPSAMRSMLEQNVFIFSGFKTHAELSAVSALLLDESGKKKPFERFARDVQAINENYNLNYLRAEYNFATQSARSAAMWAQYQADADQFYLQYRTAADERVRESHALLHGTTLPVDDPFWQKFFPPNGWNCRCTVVQVRKSKYPLSDSQKAIEQGEKATTAINKKGQNKLAIFRFNPGQDQKIFPPRHPYMKFPKEVKDAISDVVDETIHRRKIIKGLTDNLTEQEKQAIADNLIELEKLLNIQAGAPMSIQKADNQNANPKHNPKYIKTSPGKYTINQGYSSTKDEPYSINCQTCVPTYMLRLRGLDVTAGGNTPGSLQEYISRQRSFEVWLNPDGSKAKPTLTYDWMVEKGYKTMTPKRYIEYFEESTKDEGVYLLTVGWKGGGGHATILQRLKDGKLVYIEPQAYYDFDGTFLAVDNIANDAGTKPIYTRGILRIDNKVFNTKFASIFEIPEQ